MNGWKFDVWQKNSVNSKGFWRFLCPKCSELTLLPDKQVQNKGFVTCPNGHHFPYCVTSIKPGDVFAKDVGEQK